MVVLQRSSQLTKQTGRVQGTVLEPCRVSLSMDTEGSAGDLKLTISDISLNVSADILDLAQSLQTSVLEPLVQPSPDRCVAA